MVCDRVIFTCVQRRGLFFGIKCADSLERRQLGRGRDVAYAFVWAVSCSSNVQRSLADSYTPTPDV